MAQRNKRHQALDAQTILVSANNSQHMALIDKKKMQNIIGLILEKSRMVLECDHNGKVIARPC